MDCPVDGTTLLMSERHGVEVDYCPQCRGVWLDRGELDKIIDRADDDDNVPPYVPPPGPGYAQPQQPPYAGERGYGDRGHGSAKKHKRKGFLGELFDFD